jgi:hypothetical protein
MCLFEGILSLLESASVGRRLICHNLESSVFDNTLLVFVSFPFARFFFFSTQFKPHSVARIFCRLLMKRM